jgi:hypothetical protein
MKKSTYLLLAAVLIAFLIFFYQKSKIKEKAKEPAKEAVEPAKEVALEPKVPKVEVKDIVRYTPSGGVFYANFTDLNGVYEKVEVTNFFKRFIELKIFDKFRKDIEEFNKTSSLEISFDNILKIIGKDLFVSVYYDEEEKRPELLFSTVMDSSMSLFAKIFTYLIQKIQAKNKDTEVGVETYNDIDINYILDKKTNEKFYYMVIDNLGHFSSDSGYMKKIIDLVQGKSAESLEKYPKYMKAEKSFRENRFLSVFFDFQAFKFSQEILVNELGQAKQNVEKGLEFLDNFASFYGDAIVKEGIDMAGSIDVIDDASQEYIAYLNEVFKAPGKSDFSEVIKGAPLFYASYSGISFSRYYAYEKEMAKDAPNNFIGSLEEGFRSLTGMAVDDDIIPLFGDEIAYASTGIDMKSSFMPIPKLFAVVKLKDSNQFASVYDKVNDAIVASDRTLTVKGEEYSGYRYKFLMTPMGIFPGHGIVADYYMIFSNPPSFLEIVDNMSSEDGSYFSKEEQKKMSGFLFDDYHFFSYANINVILQLVPDLFDRYSPTLQGSMTNEKRKEFLKMYNDEILPLVDVMKTMKYIVWNGYYDKDKRQFLFKSHNSMSDID